MKVEKKVHIVRDDAGVCRGIALDCVECDGCCDGDCCRCSLDLYTAHDGDIQLSACQCCDHSSGTIMLSVGQLHALVEAIPELLQTAAERRENREKDKAKLLAVADKQKARAEAERLLAKVQRQQAEAETQREQL